MHGFICAGLLALPFRACISVVTGAIFFCMRVCGQVPSGVGQFCVVAIFVSFVSCTDALFFVLLYALLGTIFYTLLKSILLKKYTAVKHERCVSPCDSVLAVVAPPGPLDLCTVFVSVLRCCFCCIIH